MLFLLFAMFLRTSLHLLRLVSFQVSLLRTNVVHHARVLSTNHDNGLLRNQLISLRVSVRVLSARNHLRQVEDLTLHSSASHVSASPRHLNCLNDHR